MGSKPLKATAGGQTQWGGEGGDGGRVSGMTPREALQALRYMETTCFLPFLRLDKYSLSVVSTTYHRHLLDNSIYLISGQLKLVCAVRVSLGVNHTLETGLHSLKTATVMGYAPYKSQLETG